MNQHNDIEWMQHCLTLARQAEGCTHPNPMVGCVIVDKNGVCVGEGYHERYGHAHAEVNALAQAGKNAQGATAYVSLEPCNHAGKTPPCTDALIQAGIQRVVCGMTDPNTNVTGQGSTALRQAGITVDIGILEADCKKLNEAFCHAVTQGTPFVIIKQALTLDGFIATARGESQWITNEKARQWVHTLRATSDGILSTATTVIADNSQLTVRLASSQAPPPHRIILDRQARLPQTPDLAIFSTMSDAPTLIISAPGGYSTEQQAWLSQQGGQYVECSTYSTHFDVATLMQYLGERRLTQVLVEAGPAFTGQLIQQQSVQKLWLMYGNQILGDPNAMTAFNIGPLARLSEACTWQVDEWVRFDNNMAISLYPLTAHAPS